MLAVSIITSALTTQIKEHNRVLLEAEREKSRSNLLRALGHDLRTPLTSILGASSAIMDNDKNLVRSERLKLLSEIYEDAQWLIRMVENLLLVTRIDGEKAAEIVKVNEAVEELIPEAVMKLQKRFPDQHVSVKVPSNLLMVPMDAMLIEQVLINLMENAVLHGKHMTKINLEVWEEDGKAFFKVSDDGDGIKAEVLPHIFDGYYRMDDERTSDSKKNMGIGLSICNTIIKAHHGVLTAANKAEGGAAFTFYLPLDEE
ncbi:MAG: GHKL domain-containing protein [Clostridia bacterium]|nr:GHKL domain-containing protein [Clostridia bacterium]